ncbi:Aste57867_23024 [Aphanomyces stellatus]|uniref:Aste57867_23024 protein n=1 Tax=Aphanomyces stellatus TaxID=120398 RepID=A0A485LMG0_9STRA|nr:hypothetical protein As57867_022953 [Aphanomyces stellatus]VFT99672.1 Aste57867_23024 [Aphanomyces stellatus]
MTRRNKSARVDAGGGGCPCSLGAAWTIPPDVVPRIALFLGDTTTFFHFLQAFQGTAALGTLELFLDLVASGTLYDSELWPPVCLDVVDTSQLDTFEAIAPYFGRLHVCGIYDVAWIQKCLASSAGITALHMSNFPSEDFPVPLHGWYRTLSQLPITDLTWTFDRHDEQCPDGFECLVDLLPHLPRLVALNLDHAILPSSAYDDVAPLDALLAYVAQSNVTALSLGALELDDDIDDDADGYSIPVAQPHHWTALTTWLDRNAATSLTLAGWDCANDGDEKVEFQLAVFGHPTLQSLVAPNCPGLLQDLPLTFAPQPLTLSTLDLLECDIYVAEMNLLCRGLRHSAVTSLRVGGNWFGLDGVRALAKVLPETKIATLDLQRIRKRGRYHQHDGDAICAVLAPVLPRLAVLDVGGNGVSDAGARVLAAAMRPSTHLIKLWLSDNALTVDGAKELVDAMAVARPTSHVHFGEGNPIDEAALGAWIRTNDHSAIEVTFGHDMCHDWFNKTPRRE